jgi:hypothetical protein
MCEVFIKWEGVWCPCCGSKLRTKPKNTVDRRRVAMDLSNVSNNGLQQQQQLLVLYH